MAADSPIPALATVDAVIIVGFLVLVTVVGFLMSRLASRGLDDYFLGGKKIPWWVLLRICAERCSALLRAVAIGVL